MRSLGRTKQTQPETLTPAQIAQKEANIEAARREQREAIERRAAARVTNLAVLRERFPTTFDPEHPVPLAIGINRQARLALGVTHSAARDVLGHWTHEPAYVAAVAAGGSRLNLDGSEAAPVSVEHRQRAADRLRAWSMFRPRQQRGDG